MAQGQKGGYAWVHNDFLDDPRVGPFEIAVYIQLCKHANVNTDITFISQGKIATNLGISRKKVNEVIGTLCSLGYVSSTPRVSGNRGRSTNEYKIEDAREVKKPSKCNAELHKSPEKEPDQCNAQLQGEEVQCNAELHRLTSKKNNTLTSNNTHNTKSIIRMPTGSGAKQTTLLNMPKPASDELPTIKNQSQLTAFLRGIRGRQRSELKMKLATLEKMDWELINDTDFVYVYVDLHNKMMPTKLSISSSPGVEASKLTAFREHHKISKDEFVPIITKVLEVYKGDPNCEGVCHFGSLANAHFIFEPILRDIRSGRVERKNDYAEQIKQRIQAQKIDQQSKNPAPVDESRIF